ncbi:hypothetical protein [Brachybacterium vulturis]|uniref:hypothetical protein n=1 Tax=Brachybacterium vulturis TaxID=2017484 RepID=UPI003735C085
MTTVNRTPRLRGVEQLVKGTAHRVRARLRGSARRPALRVHLVLDGADLLNWRSHEGIDAIRLHPGAAVGAPVDFSRRQADGPPHGVIRLGVLEHQHYVVLALRGGRSRRISLPADESTDGTRNVAVTPDGRVWDIVPDPAQGAVLRSRDQVEALRGVRSLRAAHGMVTLAAGPSGDDVLLQLERRSTKERLEILPMSRDEEGIAQFRIGAEQWAKVARLSAVKGRPDSVWNLYLVDLSSRDRRERLRWAGSNIGNPRQALRYRATASLMIRGKKVEIRPYWTADQYLALEVHVTASIEGELV